MRISLRWKMLLFVFVLVLAPVLILGFNEYRGDQEHDHRYAAHHCP